MTPPETLPASVPLMSSARSRAARILLGFSLMLIAFNLRPLFPSLSVLLPEVLRQTGLSSSGAGYLTTLPVLCLGLFAPFAPWFSRWIGPERTLLVVLIVLTLGTALRGLGDIYSLFAGTALAGAAIAMGNVLLPSVVKRDFSNHAALMTGFYTMTLSGGAALAAAVTLPIVHVSSDSWTTGLAIWALPGALVALVWAPQALRSKRGPGRGGHRPGGLWRDLLAWQVTFFMGLQSAMAYCVIGWMAPILRDRGLDGVTAGVVVSVSIMAQVATCLLVPALAVRCKDQRVFNAGLAVTAAIALTGLLFAPLSTVWIWAVLQGVGQGGLFAIAMTVIVLRSPDPLVAAQLSAMAQGVGYVLAAFGPLLVGVLHSITGGYAATGWLFALLGVATACSGWGAGRAMLVRPGRVITNLEELRK